MSSVFTSEGILLDLEGKVKEFKSEREALVFCFLEGIKDVVVENNTTYKLSVIKRKPNII